MRTTVQRQWLSASTSGLWLWWHGTLCLRCALAAWDAVLEVCALAAWDAVLEVCACWRLSEVPAIRCRQAWRQAWRRWSCSRGLARAGRAGASAGENTRDRERGSCEHMYCTLLSYLRSSVPISFRRLRPACHHSSAPTWAVVSYQHNPSSEQLKRVKRACATARRPCGARQDRLDRTRSGKAPGTQA